MNNEEPHSVLFFDPSDAIAELSAAAHARVAKTVNTIDDVLVASHPHLDALASAVLPSTVSIVLRYANDKLKGGDNPTVGAQWEDIIARGTPVRVTVTLGSSSWTSQPAAYATPGNEAVPHKDRRADFAGQTTSLSVSHPDTDVLRVAVFDAASDAPLGAFTAPTTIAHTLVKGEETAVYATCRSVVVALTLTAHNFGQPRPSAVRLAQKVEDFDAGSAPPGSSVVEAVEAAGESMVAAASDIFSSAKRTVTGDASVPKAKKQAMTKGKTESGMKWREDHEWHNWTQNVRCTPKRIWYPKTKQHLQEIIASAVRDKVGEIRCSAQKHSFASLSAVGSNGYLVVVKELNRTVSVDKSNPAAPTVTFGPGCSIGEVDDYLTKHGLAFAANALATTFRYGGLVTGGCHGTAREMRTISDEVVSMTVILHDGSEKVFDASVGDEVFRAAIVNFGTFGLVWSFTLRCEKQFNYLANDLDMKSSEFLAPGKIEQLVLKYDLIEVFYWTLTGDKLSIPDNKITVKTWTRTKKAVSPFWGWWLTYKAGIWFMDVLSHLQGVPEILHHMPELMPKTHQVVRIAAESLHYQGGIENTKLTNFEIGLPCGGTIAQPDYSNLREAALFFNQTLVSLFGTRKILPVILLELRFTKDSHGLISNVSNPAGVVNDTPMVYFDIVMMTSSSPNIYDDCRTLMRTVFPVLCGPKYNGRPHFAKNWEEVSSFWDPITPQAPSFDIFAHYRNTLPLARFREIQRDYDPTGLFLNPLLRELLQIEATPESGVDSYAQWVSRSLALLPPVDKNVTDKAKLP